MDHDTPAYPDPEDANKKTGGTPPCPGLSYLSLLDFSGRFQMQSDYFRRAHDSDFLERVVKLEVITSAVKTACLFPGPWWGDSRKKNKEGKKTCIDGGAGQGRVSGKVGGAVHHAFQEGGRSLFCAAGILICNVKPTQRSESSCLLAKLAQIEWPPATWRRPGGDP